LVIVGMITHLPLRVTRLEADHRDVRASNAKLLLRSGPRLPADRMRLTDEEFRLVLESLGSRGGAKLLNESSVSRSSLQRLNTAVLKRVE